MRIIAEAGINHNGNINKALEMIREAKECGADAVKFQLYITEVLCVDRNNFDAFKILKKNEMKEWWLPELKRECDRLKIDFLCTPFCKSTAEAINPYVNAFKIASPEVCNLEFLKHIASYGKPLIISTGKASESVLECIFDEIHNPITLLYCVSKYPASPSDYNLNELERLRKRYRCEIGLSDHTIGLKTSIEAVEKHHCFFIEKHFKLDNNCVDANVSLFPQEFKKMVDIIRRLK